MGKMKAIFGKMYHAMFPSFAKELEEAVSGCQSILDVGCGSDSRIKAFSQSLYSVGVDIYKPNIEKSRQQRIHNKYYVMDVLEIGKRFKPRSFDCVIAIDVIEHLPKPDGLKLMKAMERIAKKKIVIFTPNSFLNQGEHGGNPWMTHKSGWTVDEMRQKGYKVLGINGWKPLRGEIAKIRYHPVLLWTIISEISQYLVKNIPKHAFQMLCIKEIWENDMIKPSATASAAAEGRLRRLIIPLTFLWTLVLFALYIINFYKIWRLR